MELVLIGVESESKNFVSVIALGGIVRTKGCCKLVMHNKVLNGCNTSKKARFATPQNVQKFK